jgi:hypothetical protein
MTHTLPAWIGIALALALPLAAQAQDAGGPPRPERNPFRAQAKSTQPVLPGDAPTVAWTDAQVAAAKADCAKLLSGLALDYEMLPPIKEGLCGAPAPILLKAVGDAPKVAIEPPATVTCSVARALHGWMARTVQPRARATLGSPVIKLHNATSYACRNRYGGANTPLSEHALANALDVSEFVFQSGDTVTVLANWPRVAAMPGSKPIPVGADTKESMAQTEPAQPKTDEAIEVTRVNASPKTNPFAVTTKAKTNPFVVPTAVSKSSLPVPPAEATPPVLSPTADLRSDFVRKVHDDACNIFGTVLGPEANEAHKNHFHLDMKARRHAAICE